MQPISVMFLCKSQGIYVHFFPSDLEDKNLFNELFSLFKDLPFVLLCMLTLLVWTEDGDGIIIM